jgi:TPP-dependent pyruvate/acetoin dehydrogenase alpha subunit
MTNISIDELLILYKKMLRIRRTEEMLAEKYLEWEMRCPMHLSIGQEAVAVGVSNNLDDQDVVFSNHRAHAHYLAKGGSLEKLVAELYGKETGCAGGRGGSMHLIDMDAGFYGSTPIVGGTVPLGVGAAWSFKVKKINQISVVYLGDGCFEEGVVHESLNFAALHKLPVLFVLENNLYSVYTPLSKRQPSRHISDIVSAHGIDTVRANGMDVVEVADISRDAISRIKSGNGPQFLEFNVYRWLEHCGPNNDDSLGYRPNGELNEWKKQCPVSLAKDKLIQADKENNTLANVESMSDIGILTEIDDEISCAFKFAQSSSPPDVNTLDNYVYS